MIINIDYRKKEAIYEQIINEIEKYVSLGILNSGDKIPSVRSLAIDLGINPNTVKKAYDVLESKGIIVSLSTKGCFISDDISSVKSNKVNDIIDKIEESIKELESLGIKRNEIIDLLNKN